MRVRHTDLIQEVNFSHTLRECVCRVGPGKHWRPALLLSILFWDRVFTEPHAGNLRVCAPIPVVGLQIWAAMPHFLSGVRGFEHSMHLYSWAVSLASSYIFFKQIIGKTPVKDFLVEGFEIGHCYLGCWPGTCYVALAAFEFGSPLL